MNYKKQEIIKEENNKIPLRNSSSPKMPQQPDSFSPLNQAKLLIDEENAYLKKSTLYSLSSILKRWKKKSLF